MGNLMSSQRRCEGQAYDQKEKRVNRIPERWQSS